MYRTKYQSYIFIHAIGNIHSCVLIVINLIRPAVHINSICFGGIQKRLIVIISLICFSFANYVIDNSLTHICVSKLCIINSDNELLPGRRQAIIWTNVGIFLFLTLRNNLQWDVNRNSYIFIQGNPFENVACEMAAILFRPQCLNRVMNSQWFCCTFAWMALQIHSNNTRIGFWCDHILRPNHDDVIINGNIFREKLRSHGRCCVHNASTVPWTSAGQFGRPRGVRGRPWYDLWRPRCVISYPMDVRGLPPGRPQSGRPHSLASTGPFSQAAVHRASGLLRFSQSQRGRIMDRKWGCPQYVRNRKLMSRSCPGNATATLLAALTFFVKNKLILL